MYFDALTLATVAAELQTTIGGGRIQHILQPDPLSIGLEVYSHRQRHYLLLSAHPRLARVHLVDRKLSRGVEQAAPLLLLLRKYLVGGRFTAIEHPYLERVLILSIVKERETCNYDEAQTLSTEQRCDLVVEVMEQRSNIILVDDDNRILDCIKRIPPHKSQRPLLPRHVYALPPRQNKRDPASVTSGGIVETYQQQGGPMVRALVRGYAGVSPLLAREVVHRAAETVGPAASAVLAESPKAGETPPLPLALAEALAAHLRGLLDAPGSPVLVESEEEGPTAFAAYPLTHLGGGTAQPTMNAALEAFYTTQQNLTRHTQRREELHQQLVATRERLEHQRRQLESAHQQASDLDRKRWEGEMIFAFLHTLTPGQTTLEVEGETIALDPTRTPVECAQQRFRAYEKAKSGTETIAQRLRETAARLDGLDEVMTLLEISSERDQIEQIAREAESYGYLSPPPQQGGKQRKQPTRRLRPLHLTSSDGYAIYVGRSAEQNREVTFRIGRPDDLWLHVRQIPGAHVIIRSGGEDVPDRTLQEAAGLAAYFSRARSESAVDVEVSFRKQVRPVSGGPPGLVTYRALRTVRVAPLPPWG